MAGGARNVSARRAQAVSAAKNRVRDAVRWGISWAARKGLDSGPHRDENARWWALVDEALRLAEIHARSPRRPARAFEASAAAFVGEVVSRQRERSRPIARGMEQIVDATDPGTRRRLLDLGRDARLIGELDFARRLLSEVTAAEPSSPLAWSYLADVHRAEGDLEAADRARARHRALTSAQGADHAFADGAARRLEGVLRARTVDEPGPAAAAAAVVADLVAVREADDLSGAVPGVVRTPLTDLDLRGPALRAADALLARAEAYGTGAPGADGELAAARGASVRGSDLPRIARDAVGGFEVLDLSGLRVLVAGRRVCLVADAASTFGLGLGDRIDAYDVIIRFDDFVIDPMDTGARTDVHVTTTGNALCWDVPVALRVVISDSSADWRRATVERLVPGAQQLLADESLRWPASSGRLLVSEDDEPQDAATAFARLLDFLDVSTAIDVVATPVAGTGSWLEAHAAAVDGPIVSLR